MKKEITLKIKSKYVNKYKSGYPLLFKEAVINTDALDNEGELFILIDEKNKFIAKGYLGKQNKGFGWLLSSKKEEKINEAFFSSKISVAINRRKSLYNDSQTTAFRIFNGEGDGIGGLTIDFLDGYYLINWYSKGIYNFSDIIISTLKQLTKYKAIYQKKRFDTAGKYIEEDEFVCGKKGKFPVIVKENGINFAIYLNEGAMIGVFMDQREVRKLIRDKYSFEKTVLNTFSYTGAFSVFAAAGGAKQTTSVDLANRSLKRTEEQFEINNINLQNQNIVVQDVFHYFKYAVKKKLKFDTVILDPPSFAQSKKFKFSAAKDYKNLLKEAIAITKENGVIVASTNCSTFGMDKFKGFIETAFKEMNGKYKLMEEFSLPKDYRTIKEFPEGDYLKVAFIRKIK